MAVAETPLADEIKGYALRGVGQEAYQFVRQELRNQLRLAELKPDIFFSIQHRVLDLLKSSVSLKMDPVERIRDLVQGIMRAFKEKKMEQAEGSRVTAVSTVLFFPRGRLEQFEVAELAACELLLTKINLETEMVQVSLGIGRAFTTLIGVSALLPKALNPQAEYLVKLYEHFHAGIWTGSMVATHNSTAHGHANVGQFELGQETYTRELLQRSTSGKVKSWVGNLLGK